MKYQWSKLFVLQVHLEKLTGNLSKKKNGNLRAGCVCTFSSLLIRGKERALLLINVVLDLIISTTRY